MNQSSINRGFFRSLFFRSYRDEEKKMGTLVKEEFGCPNRENTMVVELQLPSLFNNFDPHIAAANLPSCVQAYLAGLTFALAASPCSTHVLASILGYVAASRDPVIGGSLLLTYTTGYVDPLLLAASFAGALQSLVSFRKFSTWINPMSGALLLGGGLYTMLDRLFPTTMAM
ncbi:hypothetical protein Syun_019390 [Stephania yunnanensis]|uniref:Cytochrome C biogenesis protein transmembrane domain-containing protein n=1 Tax=Stephania yunnanensis TaxID=152371 RepID=A0AAP0IVR3_9MAGN